MLDLISKDGSSAKSEAEGKDVFLDPFEKQLEVSCKERSEIYLVDRSVNSQSRKPSSFPVAFWVKPMRASG